MTDDADGAARMEQLQERIGVRFRRGELIREAMTHASWNNERGRPGGPGHDNERLEYLGDAVLELVVGEYLFKRFPEYDEGQLTQLRAALVNTSTLARLAERLQLGETLFLGKGADKTGARQLPSLLANAFEAMIGAIFLDQGYRVATRVFLQNIGDLAEWSDANFKGKLQEVAQDRTGTTPSYRVAAVGGPGHKREYTADAVVAGEVVGSGRGTTKQAAEQAAARHALETLTREPKRRAAAPGRAAEIAGAADSARVRRRVAEVAADRSGTRAARERGRRSAAATAVSPVRVEPVQTPPSPPPARPRRGLLGALRSAAEALVGRVVQPEQVVPEPPAAPPPAPSRGRRETPAPRSPRPPRAAQPDRAERPAARPADAERSPSRRARSGGTPASPAERERRSAAGAAAAAPGSAPARRRRSTGAKPTTPTDAAAKGGASDAGRPGTTPPTAGDAEPRRSTRRGRRGGRGRRRPAGDQA